MENYLTSFPWLVCIMFLCQLLWIPKTTQATPLNCVVPANPACYFSFPAPGSQNVLHYYASLAPNSETDSALPPTHLPTDALIVVHGHSRDANNSFNAALLATQKAKRINNTLIIAPEFQVAPEQGDNCTSDRVPAIQKNDLLWTCGSWVTGGTAKNDPKLGSFEVLDALIGELKKQWPSLEQVTVSGFSAGAQMVQHYIGFASGQPGLRMRYVVAAPGTWLYFDRYRVQPEQDGKRVDWSACHFSGQEDCQLTLLPATADNCPNLNQWKYGTELLPAKLKRDATQAATHYAQAEIHYLEGALDSDNAKGASAHILDKSCAANAQGSFRLQRGIAYAAYDRARLAPQKNRRIIIVPGCAHDVACIFPSQAASMALFGQ